VGALAAGALQGLTEIGKTALSEAYIKLKGLLTRKFGATSGVMRAVAQLETKSDSPHRQGGLHEELAAVNAGHDPEIVAAASHLYALVQQQQQNINVRGSMLQSSINQVGRDQYRIGHNQYQIGRDQYNVQGGELIGPDTRRGAKSVISILLIIGGLLIGIPAIGMLPFFDAVIKMMIQMVMSGPEPPGTSGFTDTVNAWGTAAHLVIYTIVGVGILMVIGGFWMRRGLRKP
jgi:hypothetical protein